MESFTTKYLDRHTGSAEFVKTNCILIISYYEHSQITSFNQIKKHIGAGYTESLKSESKPIDPKSPNKNF